MYTVYSIDFKVGLCGVHFIDTDILISHKQISEGK